MPIARITADTKRGLRTQMPSLHDKKMLVLYLMWYFMVGKNNSRLHFLLDEERAVFFSSVETSRLRQNA
jgi:hypothetical protein